MRLRDVDGDGFDDVIIGLTWQLAQKSYRDLEEMKTTCKEGGESHSLT